jgi:Lipid-droplet associated hydrolase
VLAGGRREKSRPPKLVFYFAKTDHWVADETREELLRVRWRLEGKGEDWRPKMVVDEEDGLVHGWCIGQSELVAGKVGKWIGEIFWDGEVAKQVAMI